MHHHGLVIFKPADNFRATCKGNVKSCGLWLKPFQPSHSTTLDKGVHIITGIVTLSGSWGYNLNNGVVDGDTFYIMYNLETVML